MPLATATAATATALALLLQLLRYCCVSTARLTRSRQIRTMLLFPTIQEDEMPDLLKPQEVAELLKVTTRQVYNLIAEGELSAHRIGKKTVRVPRHSVDSLLQRGATQCK